VEDEREHSIYTLPQRHGRRRRSSLLEVSEQRAAQPGLASSEDLIALLHSASLLEDCPRRRNENRNMGALVLGRRPCFWCRAPKGIYTLSDCVEPLGAPLPHSVRASPCPPCPARRRRVSWPSATLTPLTLLDARPTLPHNHSSHARTGAAATASTRTRLHPPAAP
jgi:hypothetical protein